MFFFLTFSFFWCVCWCWCWCCSGLPFLPLHTTGTWGKYTPKSDVEWSIIRAKEIPGPGQYNADEPKKANMQAFGNFTPESGTFNATTTYVHGFE